MLRFDFRTTIATALIVGFCSVAAAQYPPPPPGPGPGAPSMPRPSYGSNGPAIAGATAGGAAALGGILYWKHTHAKLSGCVAGDGDKLVGDKDNQTYSLINKHGETLKPGERVELVGKKSKNDAGEPRFEVHKTSKDLGACTSASMQRPPN